MKDATTGPEVGQGVGNEVVGDSASQILQVQNHLGSQSSYLAGHHWLLCKIHFFATPHNQVEKWFIVE